MLDSEGKYALSKACLKQFFKKIGKPVRSNNFKIQSKQSSKCGIYALVYLYHRLELNKSYKSFINMVQCSKNIEVKICILFSKYFKTKCNRVLKQFM